MYVEKEEKVGGIFPPLFSRNLSSEKKEKGTGLKFRLPLNIQERKYKRFSFKRADSGFLLCPKDPFLEQFWDAFLKDILQEIGGREAISPPLLNPLPRWHSNFWQKKQIGKRVLFFISGEHRGLGMLSLFMFAFSRCM